MVTPEAARRFARPDERVALMRDRITIVNSNAHMLNCPIRGSNFASYPVRPLARSPKC